MMMTVIQTKMTPTKNLIMTAIQKIQTLTWKTMKKKQKNKFAEVTKNIPLVQNTHTRSGNSGGRRRQQQRNQTN